MQITDILGQIVLSILERLSSFRGEKVLPHRLVYQKCPLVYTELHIVSYRSMSVPAVIFFVILQELHCLLQCLQ